MVILTATILIGAYILPALVPESEVHNKPDLQGLVVTMDAVDGSEGITKPSSNDFQWRTEDTVSATFKITYTMPLEYNDTYFNTMAIKHIGGYIDNESQIFYEVVSRDATGDYRIYWQTEESVTSDQDIQQIVQVPNASSSYFWVTISLNRYCLEALGSSNHTEVTIECKANVPYGDTVVVTTQVYTIKIWGYDSSA